MHERVGDKQTQKSKRVASKGVGSEGERSERKREWVGLRGGWLSWVWWGGREGVSEGGREGVRE